MKIVCKQHQENFNLIWKKLYSVASACGNVIRQLIDEVGEENRSAQATLLEALEALGVVREFVPTTLNTCFETSIHTPEHIQHLPLDSRSRKDQPQHGLTHRIECFMQIYKGHLKFRIV